MCKFVKLRFRHRQSLIRGRIIIKGNEIILKYAKAMSVTPGQFAVIYQGNKCLGGGIVSQILK
jgi:tRNA-specific 2-thiouridylase